MSGSYASGEVPRTHVHVDAAKLWGGGAATACVAALVAFAGILVFQGVLDVSLVRPALLLDLSGSLTADYVVTAFLLALAATGLAHGLVFTTPRPRTFFTWIVGVATVCAAALPFALDTDLASQVATACINVALGICMASLLGAVMSRTVFFTTEASR